MKNTEVRELDKALFVLLYDQFDCSDITPHELEDSFVDYIIYGLIEKNNKICPFKNYSCEKHCKSYAEACITTSLDADCNQELEDIWREFISIQA